ARRDVVPGVALAPRSVMRWTALAFVVACTSHEPKKPSLDGPYPCGHLTCTSGQVCVTESAGSQCQVNLDAGIGPYDTYSYQCFELGDTCGGVLTCNCILGEGICLGVTGDGREIDFGCV